MPQVYFKAVHVISESGKTIKAGQAKTEALRGELRHAAAHGEAVGGAAVMLMRYPESISYRVRVCFHPAC